MKCLIMFTLIANLLHFTPAQAKFQSQVYVADSYFKVKSPEQTFLFLIFDTQSQLNQGFYLAANNSYYSCTLASSLACSKHLGFSFLNQVKYEFSQNSAFPIQINRVYKYCQIAGVEPNLPRTNYKLSCRYLHTFTSDQEKRCGLGSEVVAGNTTIGSGSLYFKVYCQLEGKLITGDVYVSMVISKASITPPLDVAVFVGQNSPRDLSIVSDFEQSSRVGDYFVSDGVIQQDNLSLSRKYNNLNHWFSYSNLVSNFSDTAYFTISRKLYTYDSYDNEIEVGTKLCVLLAEQQKTQPYNFNGSRPFCFRFGWGLEPAVVLLFWLLFQ